MDDGPNGFDEARHLVLEALIAEAAFDGWTPQALERSIEAVSGLVDRRYAGLLFPQGIADALTFWSAEHDDAMATAYLELDAPPASIREKISWLVERRIFAMSDQREAARRAAATLALPRYAGLGPRLVWRTAGKMWQTIGDRSLDGNYFTKRTTLSGVYLTTLAHWFGVDGEQRSEQDVRDFLARRIEGVMSFEKAKSTLSSKLPSPEQVIGAVAKMRYQRPRGTADPD